MQSLSDMSVGQRMGAASFVLLTLYGISVYHAYTQYSVGIKKHGLERKDVPFACVYASCFPDVFRGNCVEKRIKTATQQIKMVELLTESSSFNPDKLIPILEHKIDNKAIDELEKNLPLPDVLKNKFNIDQLRRDRNVDAFVSRIAYAVGDLLTDQHMFNTAMTDVVGDETLEMTRARTNNKVLLYLFLLAKKQEEGL